MVSLSKALSGAAVVAALAASGAVQAYTVPGFSASGIPAAGYPSFVSGSEQAQVAAAFTWNANADGHGTGAWDLSITSSTPSVGVFNFPNGAYTVSNEDVTLNAYFNSSGNLITNNKYLSNTYEVDGTLNASNNPNWGTAPKGYSWSAVSKDQNLFSVSLTGVAVDNTNKALGFTTGTFGGWANQPQFVGSNKNPTESLWLYSLINTGNLYCVLPRPGNNCNNSPSQQGTLPFSTSNTTWNNFLTELKNHSGLSKATFFGIGSIVTVPLPAAIWLLGGGLAGLGMFGRRSKSATGTVAA